MARSLADECREQTQNARVDGRLGVVTNMYNETTSELFNVGREAPVY
jgi:hypothetical protein